MLTLVATVEIHVATVTHSIQGRNVNQIIVYSVVVKRMRVSAVQYVNHEVAIKTSRILPVSFLEKKNTSIPPTSVRKHAIRPALETTCRRKFSAESFETLHFDMLVPSRYWTTMNAHLFCESMKSVSNSLLFFFVFFLFRLVSSQKMDWPIALYNKTVTVEARSGFHPPSFEPLSD